MRLADQLKFFFAGCALHHCCPRDSVHRGGAVQGRDCRYGRQHRMQRSSALAPAPPGRVCRASPASPSCQREPQRYQACPAPQSAADASTASLRVACVAHELFASLCDGVWPKPSNCHPRTATPGGTLPAPRPRPARRGTLAIKSLHAQNPGHGPWRRKADNASP